MRAMRLLQPRTELVPSEVQLRPPGEREVVIEVSACGVCRTDLHVVDGELEQPRLPLIPGHEVVGRITACGAAAQRFAIGARVGVPWLGWTCGVCSYCASGQENLCEQARFTGYTLDGATRARCWSTSATASRSRATATTRTRRRCSAPA